MIQKTTLLGKTYQFKDLKEIMAKANEEKAGDRLAGIAAENAQEQMAAKWVLSDLTLADIRNNPLLSPDVDEVSRIIDEAVHEETFQAMKNWTIGELREYILRQDVGASDLKNMAKGLTSEIVAAVTKIMSNLDLIQASSKIEVISCCNYEIGQKGVLAARAQPNHPTDDLMGMKASLFEALCYGMGDAVIGINPVKDSSEHIYSMLSETKEVMEKWRIPTQNCVLSHVTTQMKAVQKGAPADMIFQSIAGTNAGNKAFGVDISLLDEADELMKELRSSHGPNYWYFETGQGSELSSEAHFGIDQLTLESRCYGLAKRYQPFLVNTVVGFIGPEYLYDSKQVIRAGLEDHFMGKLQGLPMGVDICYTNHMKADQNDMENLAVLLASAGANYFIGVPMADDCMLNYQSLSYHDIATVRQIQHLRPAPRFEKWLEEIGIMSNGQLTPIAGDPTMFI